MVAGGALLNQRRALWTHMHEAAPVLFRYHHSLWAGSVHYSMLHLDGHILACLLVPPTFDHRKACSQAVYSLLTCLSSTIKHRWGPGDRGS